MNRNDLRRVAAMSVVLPLVLAGQVTRDKVPLKPWSAPQYWQPTKAESEADNTRLNSNEKSNAGSNPATATNSLVFVGITPCRIVDTRTGQPTTGAFGPPSLAPSGSRTFPIQSSSTCAIPSTAQAYSLNVTAVPNSSTGQQGFITLYPTGQPTPLFATLIFQPNFILSNAAVAAAGTSGSLDAVANVGVDMVIDINGYYIAQTQSGLTLSQGTASSPTINFAGDAGTGIYSAGPGVLNLSAGGATGLTVDKSGDVTIAGGIETSGPVNMIFDPVDRSDFPGASPLSPKFLNGEPLAACASSRTWMKWGTYLCWNSDQMYIGLKDQGNDRKDAVIAWGDNATRDGGAGPDPLRFIFTGRIALLPDVQGSVDGLEVARFTPEGAVGIGTKTPALTGASASLSTLYKPFLHVNGRVRVEDLPAGANKLVTADVNGVLNSLAFPGGTSTFLSANGTFIAPPSTGSGGDLTGGPCAANLVTKWIATANSLGCSEITDTGSVTGGRVGIDNPNPAAKLDVNGDINAGTNPIKHHYAIANRTVLSIDGTGNTLVGETGSAGAAQYGTVVGSLAGVANTGSNNSFFGYESGAANTSGERNTYLGAYSGLRNVTGTANTFVGYGTANGVTSGSNNIFLGHAAGNDSTGGDFNIYIGHQGCPPSGNTLCAESNTIRIGTPQFHSKTYISGIYNVPLGPSQPVCIDSTGKMGMCGSSSLRFKENVQDIGDTSSALFRLRPVSFRYKSTADPQTREYGLIAEEVAAVYPELVVKDANGQIQGVEYQKLTPMLLNELQKQNAQLQHQAATIEMQQTQNRNLEDRLAALEAALSNH